MAECPPPQSEDHLLSLISLLESRESHQNNFFNNIISSFGMFVEQLTDMTSGAVRQCPNHRGQEFLKLIKMKM